MPWLVVNVYVAPAKADAAERSRPPAANAAHRTKDIAGDLSDQCELLPNAADNYLEYA
jgi:hypothetical protein